MNNTQESALKYAQRHGLFHSHRHGTFSPQSCLASIQNCLDEPVTESFKDAAPSENIDFPRNSIEFDERLTEDVQGEPGSILQTRSPFSYRSGSLHDLLLELPEMGPSSPIVFKHLSDILGFIPSNWLATQYLPLISVDQKTDEGLDFPRHINRLHQALQYKVDSEQVENLKSRHNICDDEVKTNQEVE